MFANVTLPPIHPPTPPPHTHKHTHAHGLPVHAMKSKKLASFLVLTLAWRHTDCSRPLKVFRVVFVCLFVGCLTSQQQASVSQGQICSDNFTCCHTEIQIADQTFYLTQSQYTDTGPTSPSADPIMPGAWQGSHWSANF